MPGLASAPRRRVLLLVGVALLPALVLAVHAEVQERGHARARMHERTLVLARSAASRHEMLLESTRSILEALARLPDVQRLSGDCAALTGVQAGSARFTNLGVIAPDGRLVCSSAPGPPGLNLGDRSYFKEAARSRGFAIGEYQVGRITGRPTWGFGNAVVSGETLLAVLFATVDVAWLQEFASHAAPPAGMALLIDGSGMILASSAEPGQWVGRTLPEAPLVRTILAQRAEGVADVEGLDGVRRLHGFAPVRSGASGPPLFVAIGLGPNEGDGGSQGQLLRRLSGVALAALLGAGLALALSSALLASPKARRGPAGAGTSLPELRDDPGFVGALAREYDEMAAALQERQSEAAQAGDELQESEARKTAILQGALDAVVSMDEAGLITEWNPAAERMFGWSRAEALGRPLIDLVVPVRLRQAPSEATDAFSTSDPGAVRRRVETTAVGADGLEFPVDVSITPVVMHGRPSFTAFVRDITEQNEAEAALTAARDELAQRVEERTAELQEANAKLVQWVEELEQRAQDMMRLSEFGDVLRACHGIEEAYAVISKFGAGLFPRQSGSLFMSTGAGDLLESRATWGDSPPVEQVFRADECWALRRARPHVVDDADSKLLCPHVESTHPAAYLCAPMMAQGAPLGILHLATPLEPGASLPPSMQARRQLAMTVAEQMSLALSNLRLQETLRGQAIRDPLTGLFNRRYMEESLERELRRATRRGTALAVVMVDVDHFKRFNDTFGHAAGDTLLRELGALLQSQTRAEDLACRYGGEEFALIYVEAGVGDTVDRCLQLLDLARRMRVRHRNQPLGEVTLSLGLAAFPEHGSTVEAILAAADAALYRAKATGRDRLVIAESAPVAAAAAGRAAEE